MFKFIYLFVKIFFQSISILVDGVSGIQFLWLAQNDELLQVGAVVH
jgi:hypothetical protein